MAATGAPGIACRPPDPGRSRSPGSLSSFRPGTRPAILPACLPSLLSQEYPAGLGVILVDDDSTDATAKVAAGLGAGRDLTVVSARPTPAGCSRQGLGDVRRRAGGWPRRRLQQTQLNERNRSKATYC